MWSAECLGVKLRGSSPVSVEILYVLKGFVNGEIVDGGQYFNTLLI
jgi:hypothetical protein